MHAFLAGCLAQLYEPSTTPAALDALTMLCYHNPTPWKREITKRHSLSGRFSSLPPSKAELKPALPTCNTILQLFVLILKMSKRLHDRPFTDHISTDGTAP